MILSGQKDDAPDNFHFVLDKNDFVRAEGGALVFCPGMKKFLFYGTKMEHERGKKKMQKSSHRK